MPKTATSQQIQKKYRTLLKNNKRYEQVIAQQSIESYEKGKKAGKLKKLDSLADLV